jgi:hypothetical protein
VGWVKTFALGEHRPEDARVLVGDGNEGPVVAHARVQLNDPAGEPVITSGRGEDGGARALEQLAPWLVVSELRESPHSAE